MSQAPLWSVPMQPAAPAPMPTRVLIVDDDPDQLMILSEWLGYSGFAVKTASEGFEGLRLAKQEAFDVIVTDLRMPGLSGLHLLSIVKQFDPSVEVVMLTGQGTMEDAIEALREGKAFDFLIKPLHNLAKLTEVLDRAMARRRAAAADAAPPPAAPAQRLDPLSQRERELLVLLVRGMTNREIADRLCISEKTARNHLTHIYEKLQVKSRTQAILIAQRYGLA